jgi:hypothetical protein
MALVEQQDKPRAMTQRVGDDDVTTAPDSDDTTVSFGGEDNPTREDFASSEHDENLAEYLPKNERRTLGTKLQDYVKVDEESRRDHLRRLKKGLEIIGLQDVPNEETVFEGASVVNHPALAEAMVQFQSRAIAEIFPPEGPVKVKPEDDADEDGEEQADRIETFMNRQLTRIDKPYFWHVDKMLFYLPFAGSAFKKCYFDMQARMPVSRFVRLEDMIVPYDAESLEDASRYTHRYWLTANDLKRAIADKEFIEPENIWRQPFSAAAQPDNPRMLLDHSDQRSQIRHDDDSVYEICEMHIDFHFLQESQPLTSSDTIVPWMKVPTGFTDAVGLEKNKIAYPYIITFERESGEVLSIRRNWKKADTQRKKRIWFTHYKYLPGFGFYGFGLLHLIGSLGAAASGSLRLLLDGSLTSSISGGFRTREARTAGEVRFRPGEWVDVDLSAEELAKGFYTPPFKEPTPALFNTLKLLVEGIQRFTSTTESMVGEGSPQNAPVGTTLALIEQGSKVFSAIHKRMHTAAREEFQTLYELNSEYLADQPYPIISKAFNGFKIGDDFNEMIAHEVQPVSDPNIWSHTMRIAQAQGVLSLISSDPALYSEKAKRKAHRAMLTALRVHDVGSYMSEAAFIQMDAVSENMAIITNTPVRAFADQNHQAHMAIHQDFMQKSMAALDPQMQQQFAAIMAAHMAEHIAFAYRTQIEQQLGVPLPPFDTHDPESTEVPTDLQAMIDAAVAARINPAPPQGQGDPSQQQDPDVAQQHALEAQESKHQHGLDAQQAAHQHGLDAQAAAADEQRKDMASQAEIRRKDAELKAKLIREGLIKHPNEVTLASDSMGSPGPQGPPPQPPGGQPPPGPPQGAPGGPAFQ